MNGLWTFQALALGSLVVSLMLLLLGATLDTLSALGRPSDPRSDGLSARKHQRSAGRR